MLRLSEQRVSDLYVSGVPLRCMGAVISCCCLYSISIVYCYSCRCEAVAGCPDECGCHFCTLQHVCLHKYLYSSQIRNYPIIRLRSHASCVWLRFGDQCFASRSVNKATLAPHAARRVGGFCLLDYLYSPTLICVTKRLRSFVGDLENCVFFLMVSSFSVTREKNIFKDN